jgi:hypothetical protein
VRPFYPVSRFAECDFIYTRRQIEETTRTTSEGVISGGHVELMSALVFEAPADVIFDVASHDAGTSGKAEFQTIKVSNDGNGESLNAQVEREFKNAFASSVHGENGSDEVPFPEFRSQIVFDDAQCAAVEISTSADCKASRSIPLQEIEHADLDSGQRIHSGDAARTVVDMNSGEGKEMCTLTRSAGLQEAGTFLHNVSESSDVTVTEAPTMMTSGNDSKNLGVHLACALEIQDSHQNADPNSLIDSVGQTEFTFKDNEQQPATLQLQVGNSHIPVEEIPSSVQGDSNDPSHIACSSSQEQAVAAVDSVLPSTPSTNAEADLSATAALGPPILDSHQNAVADSNSLTDSAGQTGTLKDDKENEQQPARLQPNVGSFHMLTEKIPISAPEGSFISSQGQAAAAIDIILSSRSSTNAEVDLSVSSNLLAGHAQDSSTAISMTVAGHSESVQPAAENEATQ